ncbi:Cytochrome P450 monooxygenase [Pseudocercospora fuligena]|uniref:Cytochrome P450 monooxygenase n=1 Tax=Pseudocercospora fuligena TaxID=685502 RepID=A0A8H6RQ93_9PEZI|nr:Cytochrome P450 monooxygenase [Pseudocercospora fuligena]
MSTVLSMPIAGNVVRIAPNELSFSDPKAWEDIYNSKGLTMERHEILRAQVRNYSGMNASIMQALCHTKDHARHRRALAYPFSNSGVGAQQQLVINKVKTLISWIQNSASKQQPVEVTSWFGYLTMDIIGDWLFGKTFGCLDGGGPTEWSVAMIRAFESSTYENAIQLIFGMHTWISAVVQYLLLPREPERWRKIHFLNCIQATKQRMSDGPGQHKDVMHFLLKGEAERSGLTEREILLNMPVLVLAGSETTAGALSGLVYFLATHPKVYARLAKEIRGRFGSTESIDFTGVQPTNLPYLDACIRESLRCLPPQTNPSLRVVPPGGATICGESVHAGCTVSVSSFAMTHLDRNFTRPIEFRPERWVARDDVDWTDDFATDQLDASQPFLLGPRQCLGLHLAWFEIRITIVYIICHFDFALANVEKSREDWTAADDFRHFRGLKTWLKPKLPIVFTPVAPAK